MNPFVEIIKKEFWGRTLLSIVIVGSFLAVLICIEHAMLGDHELDTNWKEILMLLLGALIGGFSKVIDFWFKDHTNDKQLLDKIQTTQSPKILPAQNVDTNLCQCEDCKSARAKQNQTQQ